MKRSVIKAVSYFLLLFLLIGVMPTIPAASPAGETENDIAIVEDSNDIENDMEYELEAESDEETGIAGDETVPDTAEDGLSIETPDDLPADTDQEAAFDEAEPESSGRYEGDGLFSFTGDGSGTLEDPYIVTNEDHFKEVCDIPGIHFRLRITPPTFAPFAAFRAFRMSMYSGGGSGTIEDPYLVSNVEQLDEIRNDLSAHYKLTADIDLEGGFIPIAHNAWAGEGFTGSIDGDGHVIRGLLPFGSDFIGLIGYAEHGAILKNLTIENVTAHGSFAGSLVGYAQGITIENCFVIGGEVYGSYYAGGLVGYAEHIDVRDSAVTGVGINGMYAGGLIGVGYDMAVSESYATGNIYGGFYAGGLVGYMDSSVHIENCFALVGIESYSEYAAGLVGYSFGNIVNSYSASAEAGLAKMDSLANPSTVTNSYYLEMSDDWRGPWSGEARTEEEMKQRATFSGWDFDDVWAINEGVNMPYLRALPNPFGDEEAEEPKDPPSGDTLLSIHAVMDKQYDITLSASGIASFDHMEIRLNYNAAALELEDLCAFIKDSVITTGLIVEAGVNITHVSPGEIRLTVERVIPPDKLWSGVITVIRLRAKTTDDAIVTVDQSINGQFDMSYDLISN